MGRQQQQQGDEGGHGWGANLLTTTEKTENLEKKNKDAGNWEMLDMCGDMYGDMCGDMCGDRGVCVDSGMAEM